MSGRSWNHIVHIGLVTALCNFTLIRELGYRSPGPVWGLSFTLFSKPLGSIPNLSSRSPTLYSLFLLLYLVLYPAIPPTMHRPQTRHLRPLLYFVGYLYLPAGYRLKCVTRTSPEDSCRSWPHRAVVPHQRRAALLPSFIVEESLGILFEYFINFSETL